MATGDGLDVRAAMHMHAVLATLAQGFRELSQQLEDPMVDATRRMLNAYKYAELLHAIGQLRNDPTLAPVLLMTGLDDGAGHRLKELADTVSPRLIVPADIITIVRPLKKRPSPDRCGDTSTAAA